MKYVLITGVAGLLGSNLAKYILKNIPDYGVIGIDCLCNDGLQFGGLIENITDKFFNDYKKCNMYITFCDLDLSDTSAYDTLKKIFNEYRPEYVFHFAAYAAEGLSPFIRTFNWKNNTVSTANIINCCIEYDVKRLIYTSSMSVYGNGNQGERFTEDLIPHPLDPYAISKYACELDIQSAGIQHRLDWCIIRPHNVYGIGQNIFDRYRNVLGIWMYQKLNNEPLTVYGTGEQSRAFSNIDDVIPCLWKSAILDTASKEIINVGGIAEHTINEALNEVLNIIGKDSPVVYKEPRFEVKRAVPSFRKSIDILGYAESMSFHDGLDKMWNWAKTLDLRERFKWPDYEITKGLYSYWR